jgi:pantothenate kinase
MILLERKQRGSRHPSLQELAQIYSNLNQAYSYHQSHNNRSFSSKHKFLLEDAQGIAKEFH